MFQVHLEFSTGMASAIAKETVEPSVFSFSTSTQTVPETSEDDQVMSWLVPIIHDSPPAGEVRVKDAAADSRNEGKTAAKAINSLMKVRASAIVFIIYSQILFDIVGSDYKTHTDKYKLPRCFMQYV